jgi:hypothetical protein
MRKPIILVFLVLALSLLALTPQALIGRAVWSEGDGYNLASWEYYDFADGYATWMGVYDSNECFFNYTQNVINLQSWSFKLSLDDFYLTGYWWLSQIKQDVNFRIQNRNNASQSVTGSFFHYVRFSHFGMLEFGSGWVLPSSHYYLTGGSSFPMTVNMTKYTNSQLNIELSMLREGILPYIQHDVIGVPLDFFNNVTISMWVAKRLQLGAVGWVKGDKTDEVIRSGSSIFTLSGNQWNTGVFDFKGVSPSIASMVTPSIILFGIAGAFSIIGSRLGEHGVAGFMIGGCIALVMLTQSGLMPSWLFAVIVLIGVVGLYFWWR